MRAKKKCIYDNGTPLRTCIIFIDCTKIFIQGPEASDSNKRSCYSGHKSFYHFIYQSVKNPEGLILYLYGPEVGRSHGLKWYRRSEMEIELNKKMKISNMKYLVYGDIAYILFPWM